MKDIVDYLLLALVFVIGIICGYSFLNSKIDLPEEYKLISKDHFKPDTLLGYYIDDKLYIEFKQKKR